MTTVASVQPRNSHTADCLKIIYQKCPLLHASISEIFKNKI